MRACFLVDALGSIAGMLVFPLSDVLSGTPPRSAFLNMYEAQSWALIPQVTNVVLAIGVFIVFSLPQLKGFVAHHYKPIVLVVGTLVWNCWVFMSAMVDPSRPNKGGTQSWAGVTSLPPSLTCSRKRSLTHSFTLPSYHALFPSPHLSLSLSLSRSLSLSLSLPPSLPPIHPSFLPPSARAQADTNLLNRTALPIRFTYITTSRSGSAWGATACRSTIAPTRLPRGR